MLINMRTYARVLGAELFITSGCFFARRQLHDNLIKSKTKHNQKKYKKGIINKLFNKCAKSTCWKSEFAARTTGPVF